MLTIKQIRDDKQAAIRKLAKKGVDAAPVIARIETLDDRRKAIQTELDNTLAAQNKAAKEIGALMGQGRRDEAEERKRFVADLKEKSNRLQAESHNVQEELQAAIVSLPNFPADIVPEGKTAEDNLVVKLVESYTQLPENPLPALGTGAQIRHHRLRPGRETHRAQDSPSTKARAPVCSVR